jgi:TPP-dependent pyruvate/acetoin dehydrogenase alpha subunit
MPSPATLPNAAVPDVSSAPPKPMVLSAEKVREMYVSLLECHLISECDGVHPAASNSPMDAILSGSIAALKPEDKIVLAHWNAVAGHLRGVPLEDLFAPTTTGTTGSGAKRPMLSDANPPLLELAAGLAWGEILQRSGKAVLVFPDSSAKPRAGNDETLRFAFTRKLPAVFITKTKPAARGDNSATEQTFERGGMPCMAVDADDTVAIFRVAGESLRKAREGGGPTWIDCHSTTSPHQKPSNASAPKHAPSPAHSAIELMEQFLTHRGLFSSELKEKTYTAFKLRLRKAMQQAAKRSAIADLGAEQGIFCIANNHSVNARHLG